MVAVENQRYIFLVDEENLLSLNCHGLITSQKSFNINIWWWSVISYDSYVTKLTFIIMFSKSDCCRMNFEKPRYGLEIHFCNKCFIHFPPMRIGSCWMKNPLMKFFCHTIPHMGKSWKSQMTNGHLRKCFCHTIPQVGGGGSTLSSHPIPTLLVVPFLGRNYEWWRW